MRTDNDNMVAILELCHRIDSKALEVYQRLAERSRSAELRGLWHAMSEDEREHIQYWLRLREMAGEGMLPAAFEQPDEIKEELERIDGRVNLLLPEGDVEPDNVFLLAFRLEFYMLHPTFAHLLHFMKPMGEKTPADSYEEHLNRLVTAMDQHEANRPELELLAETILRLWRENQKLAVRSHTDELTGLLNRRGLYQAIVPLSYLAQRTHAPAGILMVDLDDFKSINDRHGHLAGDRVLKETARILKSQLRASDVIGRFCGEEFLLFLSALDPGSLGEVAEKIRRALATDNPTGMPVTVSIGGTVIAFEREIEAELERGIKAADDALYEAKAAGKNTFRQRRPAAG